MLFRSYLKHTLLCSFIFAVSFYSSTAQTAGATDIRRVAADFRSMLARPKVGFDPVLTITRTDSMIIEKGFITTDRDERVPVVIYKPVSQQVKVFPVVICHHGTGGTKDQADIKMFMNRFVKLGFMSVAIDARYHGERVAGGAHGKKEYEEAAIAAWKNTDKAKQAHPFLYDTVYDIWRLTDYLTGRPDVDASRIGMMGISMGGIETWLAASVDPRIKVAVPIIAAQSFKWSLENNRWQGRAATIQTAHEYVAKDLGDDAVNSKNVAVLWQKLVPGITGEFDCPSMLRLFAPRPLLLLSTEKDNNCPLPGALIAYKSAQEAYASVHASDKLNMDVAPGLSHRLAPQHIDMAVNWFKKWL